MAIRRIMRIDERLDADPLLTSDGFGLRKIGLSGKRTSVRSTGMGARVQWGARRDGSDGKYGSYGNVLSVSYRFHGS